MWATHIPQYELVLFDRIDFFLVYPAREEQYSSSHHYYGGVFE